MDCTLAASEYICILIKQEKFQSKLNCHSKISRVKQTVSQLGNRVHPLVRRQTQVSEEQLKTLPMLKKFHFKGTLYKIL